MPSTNLRHDHEALVEVLARCAVDHASGPLMRIGLRNHFGDVCLIIEAEGPQETLNVTSCLEERDMVDELSDATGPVERCDAIFRDR